MYPSPPLHPCVTLVGDFSRPSSEEGTHGVRNGKEREQERISVHGVLLEGDYLATLPMSGVGSTVGTETESL